MNFLKLTPGLLAVCVLTFNGCKKDSETTGETTLSYEFQAENTASIFSSASEKTLVYLTVPGIRWTTATLNLSKLRFSAMREGKPFESSLANIENINLLEAGKYFGSISLPKGWYNDVQVTLTLKKSATAAIPLTLKATLTTETGSVVPVEFYFNDDAELNILADRLNASGDKYIGQIRLKLSTLGKLLSSCFRPENKRSGSDQQHLKHQLIQHCKTCTDQQLHDKHQQEITLRLTIL